MADQERTEQATPKRRQDARKRGEVAQSGDVAVVLVALVATLFLARSVGDGAAQALDFLRNALGRGFAARADELDLATALAQTLTFVAKKTIFFFLTVVAATLAARWLQTGFLFLPNKLAPDLTRLSPRKNLRKVFSFSSSANACFSLVKFAFVLTIVALALKRDAETIVELPSLEITQIGAFFARFIVKLAYSLCGAGALVATLDYAAKRWKYEQDLKMTVQELRDELKEESGAAKSGGRRAIPGGSASPAVASVSAPTSPRPVEPRKRDEKRDRAKKKPTSDDPPR